MNNNPFKQFLDDYNALNERVARLEERLALYESGKEEKLLTANQLAKRLNCSDDHIRNLARKNLISYLDLSEEHEKPMYRFNEKAVREALNKKNLVRTKTKDLELPRSEQVNTQEKLKKVKR